MLRPPPAAEPLVSAPPGKPPLCSPGAEPGPDPPAAAVRLPYEQPGGWPGQRPGRLTAPGLAGWAGPAALLALTLAVWEGAVRLFSVPPYLLPGPSRIASEMAARSGLLLAHAAVTFGEVLAGFALGAAAGALLAVVMDAWPAARAALVPWLVASQAVPVFAVAPLLVLWFGYGWVSKVVMASVITFFPVAISLLDGLRPDPDALRLFVALGASRRQVLWLLKLPGAVPALFSGLKVAASVATIAAVIGEWVGSRAGLGFLMMQANAQLRVPLVFAALAWLSAMGLALYGLVALAERRLLASRAAHGGRPRGGRRRVPW